MQVGDKAKIVNYGHLIWFSKAPEHAERVKQFTEDLTYVSEDDTFYYYDIRPEYVGREVTVVVKKGKKYTVQFHDRNRVSWFTDANLEKIW